MATDGSRLPMLIDQPEFCNDLCDRAPHNAPGTNLGQEFVVVRAHSMREASVCVADFGEQNGDLRFPSHGAAPTIEDGRHHIIEKMDTERRSKGSGDCL
jgi:hypothetical protein